MKNNSTNTLSRKKCIPCEGGTLPLTHNEAQVLLGKLDSEWMLIDDAHMLARTFKFKNFVQTMKFVNEVARIAEEEGHHPDIAIFYNVVELTLWTHAVGGLSVNDFILASKIDTLDSK